MVAKRPVRSAFLITASTLALTSCQSEGGAPHSTNPTATSPPVSNPPATSSPAGNPPATSPPAGNPPPPTAPIAMPSPQPSDPDGPPRRVYYNPPPPIGQRSFPMNPNVAGQYVVTTGARCVTRGNDAPTACPDFMKDPAWKKCVGGLFYMSGDAARCYCKPTEDSDTTQPLTCPAAKPSPWPPSNG